MPLAFDATKLATVRAARQLLHRPRNAGGPAEIARAIGGVQAQEVPAGRLAFRSRNASLTAADVDHARARGRSLVRIWAMRNTAHLIATDDLPWMRPLFAPLMESFCRRRLGQLGIDPTAQARALSLIKKHLAADGPLTRTELTDRLNRAGIALESSHRVHVFPLAVTTGVAHFGLGDGSGTRLIATADWIPTEPDLDRDAALAELARRYLNAFGPATEADFAGWAGLPLRDIRTGLEAIASEIRELSIVGQPAWTPKGRSPGIPPDLVRLLPAYDSYLMGYRNREFLTTATRWKRIGPGGGILRPTITVGGKTVGLWRIQRKGNHAEINSDPFDTLDATTKKAVKAEIEDIRRFEGQ